jgi:hypothetical protein
MHIMKAPTVLSVLLSLLRPSRASCVALAMAVLIPACVPPRQTTATVNEPEPEPESEGAIPWAPGEAPKSAEETTREAPPEPEEEPIGPVHYEEDGIEETHAGAACTGKAPPALRALLDVRVMETKSCSAKIPAERAGANGDIKVNVRIARTGQVDSVEILSDTLNVPDVAHCVKEVLGAPFTEARPRGGCAVFVLPLHFESAKVQEAQEAEASDSRGQ